MPDLSTGGYLQPTSAAPAYDAALDAVFQAMVVGITALPTNSVRPRWQPNPPAEPGISVDWCAIGVIDIQPIGTQPSVVHDSSGQGSDTIESHEELEVLASFYGPDAWSNASLFRDGLRLPQNREALFLDGLVYVSTDRIRNAPALINNTWQRKVDLSFTVRREVDRTFAILNLESAEVAITAKFGSADGGSVTTITTQAGPNPPEV